MFIIADIGIRLRQGDGKLEDSLVRTCLIKGKTEGLKRNWNKNMLALGLASQKDPGPVTYKCVILDKSSCNFSEARFPHPS